MNLERLKIFYRVATYKNFTKAAEVFHVTPGALSKSVKALEEELQVRLFDRTSNVLKLTPQGEELYGCASNIMQQANFTRDQLKDNLNAIKGHLDIYSTHGFCTMYLSNYLHEFALENPDITISIKTLDGRNKLEYLSKGVLIHPHIKDLKGYEQYFLTNFTFQLYASKEYLEQHGVPKTLDDLDHHRLIAYSFDREYQGFDLNWHLNIGREKNNSRRWCLEVDATFGRCKLAANGVGIISVPKQHPDIKKYGLIQVLPEVKAPASNYYIVVKEIHNEYARVKRFIDFMSKKYAE